MLICTCNTLQVPDEWQPGQERDESPMQFFGEMSPIFCTTDVPYDLMGDHMQNFVEKANLSKKPRRLLVGGMGAQKILLATPLLKWHMEKGLVVTNVYTTVGLQNSLDLLYDYCNTWKLTMNLEKSNILVCRSGGRKHINEIWFWGDHIMEQCDNYKYLGITFSAGGITNTALTVLNDQAKKAMLSLLSGMNNIGIFPPAAALHIFHSSITPILHYCSEVWGYLPAVSMQITLNRFCKNILGVKLSTSNCAVAGELGQYPLVIARKISMLKYWVRIITGPRDQYRFMIYQELKTRYNEILPRNYSNWANEIRKILIEVGLEYIWHNEVIDNNNCIGNAKQTLIDLYITQWHNDMYHSDKMRGYRLYKSIFCHESYLAHIKVYKYRRALSCLRLSAHSLEIEIGRYNPPRPPNERHCKLCNSGDIEDEYHFLLVCSKHNALRRRLIPRQFWQRPSMHKFIDLMKSESYNNGIAKFAYFALRNRDSADDTDDMT